jgi:hypothetical protein
MSSIVGTWKLLRATARDAAGAALPAPYGPQIMGRVVFTADGRMMSVVCDGSRELPTGLSWEYSSYCGNYSFDGTRLAAGFPPPLLGKPIGKFRTEPFKSKGFNRVPSGRGVERCAQPKTDLPS